MTDKLIAEIKRLQVENTRLTQLLEANRIEWRVQEPVITITPLKESKTQNHLSIKQKIKLFRKLFHGRSDVYPVRWENSAGSKSGYVPACGNEWITNLCEKPKVKCSHCQNRKLLSVTDSIIYKHLNGEIVIGVYPLLTDEACHFLAVDFDEADWQADIKAFAQSCRELNIPVSLEISRSRNGAHAWIFFEEAIPAYEARRLGGLIISHTCARTRQLKLSSYDRLFPNQDVMPKGGFGNLIALPLQKAARKYNGSIFVDEGLAPYNDQWDYLASVELIKADEVRQILSSTLTDDDFTLESANSENDGLEKPWQPKPPSRKLEGVQPSELNITLANMIYFRKSELTISLTNRLVHLAAFRNPEFYKAQAMRMSVWGKPRIIGCAENHENYIALPRGCLDDILSLLSENSILAILHDERNLGNSLDVSFKGQLRPDQNEAVNAMLLFDTGILCAHTAFGKTVTAAEVIAKRRVNTLILVHRTELLKQWQARLQTFLNVGKETVGNIGGGKSKPTGKIDIAVIQSLSRPDGINLIIENYGQIIVDECHHLSAFSFESLLKAAKAKYVLGLTATPIRRDGHQPIIFMQCGPIRHKVTKSSHVVHELVIEPHMIERKIYLPTDAKIQDVFRHITNDEDRNQKIIDTIKVSFNAGRKILVLTERTEHAEALYSALNLDAQLCFLLHGRLKRSQRLEVMTQLENLSAETPRVLIATGKLVGEGFDHPALDTLVLAMPISWSGTLQQYAGRLHRESVNKGNVTIIDFVDAGSPILMKMWAKRQKGYKIMGYTLANKDLLGIHPTKEQQRLEYI